ncbi:metallophosphoesterase (plasmid) [Rhodococcus pseudokoreensis]|uniref:Metallophosphoesterase n=1 Tax=Rhodococcus pseudokoreensis TaxID=2811421 RepID=A0A974VXH0_9NOCA|nr:metallophosphoesterase [Rhodococcus pseudokoreensis]QSE87463.1 metallophosphoesterase [Rhodococcus pseudokoreensis]
MNTQVAIIGDIHGNSAALAGILRELDGRVERYIFTGDFVNRGEHSAAVVQGLVELALRHRDTVFVSGNHDRAFLTALETGDLSRLLKMGGAPTVSSYVGYPCGDIAKHLQASVPATHLAFFRNLVPYFRSASGLLVTHGPRDRPSTALVSDYHVYGHVPQHDRRPSIAEREAAIDTGCGSVPDGRLTALLYPALTIIQVDGEGRLVSGNL